LRILVFYGLHIAAALFRRVFVHQKNPEIYRNRICKESFIKISPPVS
jgi:hypothetical protein